MTTLDVRNLFRRKANIVIGANVPKTIVDGPMVDDEDEESQTRKINIDDWTCERMECNGGPSAAPEKKLLWCANSVNFRGFLF